MSAFVTGKVKMKSFKGLRDERRSFKRAKERPGGVNGRDKASLHIVISEELRKKIKARARAEGQSVRDLLTEVLTLIFWHEEG
jgi:hypothetical protein